MHLYVIICGVFHLSSVIQSQTIRQETGVITASVGDNVTLRCFYDSQVAMHFSWYRQLLGSRPELLSTIYKFGDPAQIFPWLEKNPRFSLQRKEGTNHLHISDIHLSDSATYYCGSSHSNMVEFGEGIFLSVEGDQQQGIIQTPASKTIQPGGSVTLNCTVKTGSCDGERSVYWFRHGSRQGFLHTHRDQCKPVLPSPSCIYHLQKTNLNSLDAGTYYCAVASCGEILFGNGSKLLIGEEVEDQEDQIRILVWLSIIRAGILLFFVMISFFVVVIKTC